MALGSLWAWSDLVNNCGAWVGVVWTKSVIGIRNLSLQNSQEIKGKLFCFISLCFLHHPNNYFDNICVYLSPFNLCMYDHTLYGMACQRILSKNM
jgi:hypothetical protein